MAPLTPYGTAAQIHAARTGLVMSYFQIAKDYPPARLEALAEAMLEKLDSSDLDVCMACSTMDPLLTGPGTSGRAWKCDSCGKVMQAEA